MEISIKSVLLGFGITLVATGVIYSGLHAGKNSGIKAQDENEQLKQRFEYLSNQQTNFCAAPNFIDSKSGADRLQGSCCAEMDFDRYKDQIEDLKKYDNISVIPSDPYDIPVPLATELLGYDKNYVLTPKQQAVYDEAMKMADEHGPCCCKCWRWYAFEGQAKYMIRNLDFTSKQVAEVWDLEDGCGGKENSHRQITQPMI